MNALRLVVILGLAVWAAGCATYTDHTRQAQTAVVDGQIEEAITLLNAQLNVDGYDEQPAELDDDKVLYLLERATLLQALGNYGSAARDMIHIDDRLEWVDFTGQTTDNLLQLVYTDDAGAYRAPPHERLLLNTMNMINFLALGDGESARVEARRFDTMQQFYLDTDPEQVATNILGMGNYLAGVSFELSEQFDSAVRFYTEAYAYGVWPEADDSRLQDLINLTGYRGQGLGERRDLVGDLFERASHRERPNRQLYRDRHRTGDVLFIVQTGMVPYRRPERLGMQEALIYGRSSRHGARHIDGETGDLALQLYFSGTLNWVNYTQLSYDGLPRRRSVRLDTGETTLRLGDPIDLSGQIEASWDEISRTVVAAGISRAVARHVAGAGTAAVAEAVLRQSERMSPASQLVGVLAGTTLKAALAASDTPDTRSWITLPADVHLVRTQLPPGERQVEVRVNGRTDRRTIDVHPNRFGLHNFSRLR